MPKNNSRSSSGWAIIWSKKLKLWLSVPVILLLVIFFMWWVRNNQKDAEYQKSIQDKVAITNTNDVKNVVQKFGKEKGENTKDLTNSSSNVWDKAKLDKAYYNLIYADKVGSFNDVYAMLSFVDAAEKSGLNIDDNSYGVDQKERSDIKLRADKIVESRKKGTAGS